MDKNSNQYESIKQKLLKLQKLAELADEWEVDLWWHVEAKMRYNQNRPYKHGKKY